MPTPKITLIYDFDWTLAPGNMQEHGFLHELGINPSDFWSEVNQLTKKHNADMIMVYMMQMIIKAQEKQLPLNRNILREFGQSIKFFTGVEEWFGRINAYGKAKNVEIEHYIISSGNQEIIEGTTIAQEFKQIFASAYKYDHNGVPEYPAVAINYTTKTQFLFKISKWIMEVSDSKKINERVTNYDVPFSNMIFIGDGETDIPCFSLVKEKGGVSIAVYQPSTDGAKEKGEKLIRDGRVHCAFQADYSAGKNLDKMVKAVIDRIEIDNKIAGLVKNDLG